MNTAWTRTAVSERLGLRWPLIQGPFGGGLSSVDLTVAVSAAGGLGSFGAHHLDAAAIEATAAAIRARTDRPFALNLWIPHQGSDDAAQASAFFEARDALAPLFDELGVPLPDCPARYAPPFDEQFEALLRVRPPRWPRRAGWKRPVSTWWWPPVSRPAGIACPFSTNPRRC